MTPNESTHLRAAPATATARPFDLVILDLDGTILRHDATISAGVARTIADVQAAGVPVTIATGRTLDYVRAAAAPLAITTPVVTTQGAVIGDPLSGQMLLEDRISSEAAQRLAAWADENDRLCALFVNDDQGHTHIVQSQETGDSAHYDHIMGTPRRVVRPLLPLLKAHALDGIPMHEPVKFMIVSDAHTEPDLVQQLQSLFGPAVTVARTHPQLVEVTPPGVDKATGVTRLCAHLGVDPGRVLAIGDQDNDITMFNAVGTAVAVANGSPGARSAAHWVAPSIDADGAAVAMQALVLGSATHGAALMPARVATQV